MSVAVQAPSPWTTQDMVDWMYNVGRHKIWMTNYIVRNEIKPTVDDIDEKMGQGLVGEWEKGNATTVGHGLKGLWTYIVPTDNPKKVSFWINLKEMSDGDTIQVGVQYDTDADGSWEVVDDTPTREFLWNFANDQTFDGKLIIDELPVATSLYVSVYQGAGTSFTIYWHAIIEEM